MDEILCVQICLCEGGPAVPGYPCKEPGCTWHLPKCPALTDEAAARLLEVTGQKAIGDPTACPYWPEDCECDGETLENRPGDDAIIRLD